MFQPDSAFLFFGFQILYLRAPAAFIRRIIVRDGNDSLFSQNNENDWQNVREGLRETFRSVGVMSTLLAAAAAALLVIPMSLDHEVVQILLLSSLACSIVSAKVSVELLSGLSFWSHEEFAEAWEVLGIKFVIVVCTPTAWINFAIYAFEASLLAMAWHTHKAATVAITLIIGSSFLLNFLVDVMAKGFNDPFGVEMFKKLPSRNQPRSPNPVHASDREKSIASRGCGSIHEQGGILSAVASRE